MNGSFAAWLSSWSRQTPRKSRYISSTTGRMPAIAAPTPRPDDRGLGDRRVAHAVAEPVVQAARQPEHVAAGADVDAGDEHPVVAGELGLERGADRVHGAEHRRVGRRRRRLGRVAVAARTTKSVSVAGGGRGELPGRLDGARRARRATDGSSASIVVVGDAGRLAAGAACTSSGSRASHSCDLVGATGSAAGSPS